MSLDNPKSYGSIESLEKGYGSIEKLSSDDLTTEPVPARKFYPTWDDLRHAVGRVMVVFLDELTQFRLLQEGIVHHGTKYSK
jgi:hypothetical protein